MQEMRHVADGDGCTVEENIESQRTGVLQEPQRGDNWMPSWAGTYKGMSKCPPNRVLDPYLRMRARGRVTSIIRSLSDSTKTKTSMTASAMEAILL